MGENHVQMGVSAGNLLAGDAPPQLVRQLLEARLQAELSHRSPHGVSETEVQRDWDLLQKSMAQGGQPLAVHTAQRSESLRGNQQ
jgi:hypothetical protein